MSLADARKNLPALKDLDDAQFVDALHTMYYPELDKAELSARLGYTPPAPPVQQAGLLRSAGDIGIKLAQGAVDLGSSVVGLGSLATGGLVGKAARAVGYDPKATNEALGQYLSDSQKAADEKVAKADGFVDTVAASIQNPRAIIGSIAESAPGMLAGMGVSGAVARGIATKAALATGEGAAASAAELAAGKSALDATKAAMATKAGATAAQDAVEAAGTKLMAIGSAAEGAQSAGQIADDAQAAGRSYGDYALPALAAGAGTAAIGFGAGKLMGDAATEIATGARSAGVRGGLAKRAGKEFFSEGVLEEMPQSAQEQWFTNVAQGEQDRMKGVGNAAGAGLVTGGVMGAGMGALQRNHAAPAADPAPQPAPVPAPLPDTGPLSQAANAGQQATADQAAAANANAGPPLPTLEQIDARLAELDTIARGAPSRREQDQNLPPVKARKFTPDEQAEFTRLVKAREARTAIPEDQRAEYEAMQQEEEATRRQQELERQQASEQAAAAAARERDDAQFALLLQEEQAQQRQAEQERKHAAMLKERQEADTTNAIVEHERLARAEANRAALRNDVLADASIPPEQKKAAFQDALRRDGYINSELNDTDHTEIDRATLPVPSAPNELVDAVPERKTMPAPEAAPAGANTAAVDAAIAAGMRLKSPGGAVLHKPGSSKIFRLSTAQKAYYQRRMAEQAPPAAADAAAEAPPPVPAQQSAAEQLQDAPDAQPASPAEAAPQAAAEQRQDDADAQPAPPAAAAPQAAAEQLQDGSGAQSASPAAPAPQAAAEQLQDGSSAQPASPAAPAPQAAAGQLQAGLAIQPVEAAPQARPGPQEADIAAVDAAIAAGMRLKTPGGAVLHKPGSSKIVKLSAPQKAHYLQRMNETAAPAPDPADAAPAPPPAVSVAPTQLLKNATRKVAIKGMEGDSQPDPVAQEILRTHDADKIDQKLAEHGIATTGVIGAGASSIVLDADDRVVRLGLGPATPIPPVEGVLQPILQGNVGNVRYDVMPKADTANVTAADVAHLEKQLAAQGYAFSDPHTDNVGKINGAPFVIDPGAVTRQQPEAPSTPFDIAAHGAATSPHNDLPEPTQAQKEANNYKVGRVRLHGLNISIENPAGSVRSGVDRDGTPWENVLQHHYGDIKRTTGADGDNVDVFIGARPESDKVFVVDQVHPDSGKFDEHKVMLGFDTVEEAAAAYRANYAADWDGGRNITETSVPEFKEWLDSDKTKKPFAKLPPTTAPSMLPFDAADHHAMAATLEAELARHPEGVPGRTAEIRASLLKHQAALLGRQHDGAAIPDDVQFKDSPTDPELVKVGGMGQLHALATSPSTGARAGGFGDTTAAARADAMVGLMLKLNERAAKPAPPPAAPAAAPVPPGLAKARALKAQREQQSAPPPVEELAAGPAPEAASAPAAPLPAVEPVEQGAAPVQPGLARARALRDQRSPAQPAIGTTDELVDVALSRKDGNKAFFDIGPVAHHVAERVAAETGVNVHGWTHVIDEAAVRHIFKQHGDTAAEAARGQVAVTKADITAIASIIADPDSVEDGGRRSDGGQSVIFKKQIGDAVVHVQAMREGRNKLAAKTLWKVRIVPPAASDVGQVHTSETSERNSPQGQANIAQDAGAAAVQTAGTAENAETSIITPGVTMDVQRADEPTPAIDRQHAADPPAPARAPSLDYFRDNAAAALPAIPAAPADGQATVAVDGDLTPPEMLQAKKDAEQLNRRLAREGMAPVRVLRSAPSQQFALARRIGAALGIKVNYIGHVDGFEGMAYRGVAYLADGMRNPELAIAGHETLHALDQQNPELGRRLRARVGAYLRDGVVAARWEQESAQAGANVSIKTAEVEVLADINGAMWIDPLFWRDLARADRNLFRQAAYAFMQAATRAIAALRGARFDVAALVSDVAAVRAIMVDAWAEHNTDRDAAAASPAIFSATGSSVPLLENEWLPARVIADEIEKRIGQFAHQPPIRIRDRAFGTFGDAAKEGWSTAGATYDGVIYLFRDRLRNMRDVQVTLFHELLHYGLRRFLTKEQYITQMLALHKRDAAIAGMADHWAASADGELAAQFGGPDFATARGVDEALALLAEPNGGKYLNQSAMATSMRAVQRWLAGLAELVGLKRAAAVLRGRSNEEARALIIQIFGKIEHDATPASDRWDFTADPAFSRDARPEQPADDAGGPTSRPDVIIGSPLGELSRHPDYATAKAGDGEAAIRVVEDVVKPAFVDAIRTALDGRQAIIQPVAALESTGKNRLPSVAAVMLGQALGLRDGTSIVQSSSPKRTGLAGLERIFRRPQFNGDVEPGQSYFLVDDTLTQGGTLAALAAYIEGKGGHVIGSSVLTGKQYSAKIGLSSQTLGILREKFGDIEQQFQSATGYGFDALTESEARYLANYRLPDAIRDRIVQGGQQARDGHGPGLLQQEAEVSPQEQPDSLVDGAPGGGAGVRQAASPDYDDLYENIDTRPGTTDAQRQAGRAALAALARRLGVDRIGAGSPAGRGTATVLGSRLLANFVAGQANQLVGQVARTPADLAALAQVYRDPRFETLRVLYMSGDAVAGETGYTSRLPAQVAFPGDLLQQIGQDKARFGADGYYLMHNHPSGSAEPSDEDKRATTQIAGSVGGLLGHIVIDHNEYSVIAADGRHQLIEAPQLNGVDFTATPELAHRLLGVKISGPVAVAQLAKALQIPAGHATMVLIDAGGRVQLLVDMPMGVLADTSPRGMAKGKAMLRRMARESGSGGHRFIVLPDGVKVMPFAPWVEAGAVTDVVAAADAYTARANGAAWPDDFLRHHPRSFSMRDNGAGAPGGRRAAIGAAPDALSRANSSAAAPRLSLSESSVPLPPADWVATAVIAQEVEDRIGRFAHQPAIRIADEAFGLLPGVARDERVAGATYKGTIYLFRDNLPDLREVRRTLFHALLHYGLQRFLSEEQYISKMKALYQRDAYLRARADQWIGGATGQAVAAYDADMALARGVDEALAELAEPNAGVYIKTSVRAKLERTILSWLADLAGWMGMADTAAALRGVRNQEARALIRNVFAKIEQDAAPTGEPWADAPRFRPGAQAADAWAEHNTGRDAAGQRTRPVPVFAPALDGLVAPENQLSKERLERLVDAALAGFPNAPAVFINDSPGFISAQGFADGRAPVSAGAMVDGKIFLFRNGISSTTSALATIWHELFHFGLRKLMTPEAYATSLTKLYSSDAEVKLYAERWKKTEDAAIRQSNGVSVTDMHLLSIEEALATLAEKIKLASAAGVDDAYRPGDFVHNVLRWMSGTARAMGLAKIGDALRRMTLSQGERFVESIFTRIASGEVAHEQTMADLDSHSINYRSDLNFSRAGIGGALAGAMNDISAVRLPANYLVGDWFNQSGKLSWWHKTVGTMDNLARRSPDFARVYDAVQSFIGDVSRYAVLAADLAPTLLPKLENIGDVLGARRKKPLTAADTKAIGAPIFEGTLVWARDAHGDPVRIAVLEEQAARMTTEQKAQILLQKRIIDDEQNKAWRASPLKMYEATIERRFNDTQLKAGVVWTDAELRAMFGLNDAQVGMYREFRAALDKSLTNLTISEMVKLGGKDAKGLLDAAVATGDITKAGELLRDHFIALARESSEKATMHLDTARQIMDLGDKGRGLMERGYAPLSRFGKYTVYVQNEDADGQQEQVYFGMFETQFEAAKMARQMQAEHPDAEVTHGTVSEQAYKLFAGVSPETIELFGSMVGLDSQKDAASTEVYQTYLKLAKNNRSSMKRLIQRKGISGFSEDAGRVLAGFIYSNARLTAGNAHLGEIDEAVTEIPKQQGELKDAAIALRDHIKNPEGGGNKLGGLMFAQFLGGSVASAMVNLTQPFTMTLPFLSQYGGLAKAGAQIAAALKDFGKKQTGDAGLDAALQWATEEGIVAPQEVHFLQAQAAGKGALQSGDGTAAGDARAAVHNTMSKVMMGWGKLFAWAELTNRRVTFIAAYRTAVQQGMADPARFAQEAVTQTQGVYNSGNKARWARGTIGSLALTFKQYGVTYLELLSRMAFAGAPGSKERDAGRRGALYMLAVLFLMSGADGLPFEQDLEDALDGILQRMGYNFSSKRAKQAFLTDVLGEGWADFALKGFSSLPGMPVDVAGRFGMGNLIPATGLLTKKESYTADLGELAGPAGDLARRAFSATGKALGGDLPGALLEISPASVRNVAKGIDMAATGTYRNGRDYKINDVTALESAMKIVGFQPNSTANIQDAVWQEKTMVAQNRMRSKEIAEHWAQGIANHDEDMVNEARQMRDDWNAKNPDTRINVNMPGVIKRVREMRRSVIERSQMTAPKALKEAVRRELAETRG